MRIILSIAVSAVLLFGQAMNRTGTGQALAEEQQESKKDAMSQKEKASYSLGYKTGINIKNISGDLDLDIFIKAFREGFSGDKAAMTDQEMVNTIQMLQMEMKAKQAGKKKETAEGNKELAEKNKKEGETFLAENAKKEGVVTQPSGLQYKIIKEGTGKQPAMTDRVKVHYRGTFINGAEFYNSYKSGQPMVLGANKFIKGLGEGLQLMKEGSKWILYIPSNLAYGSRGSSRGTTRGPTRGAAGGVIGPNQTLIFEVELISVESQEPKSQESKSKE